MKDKVLLSTAKRHNLRLLKHIDRVENNKIKSNLDELQLRILFDIKKKTGNSEKNSKH